MNYLTIHDYLTCESCGESYFGVFKSSVKGEITCFNCKEKQYIDERLTIDNTYDKQTVEQVLVLDLLEKDLNDLYPLFTDPNSLPIEDFIDDTGNFILEKLYFQGNPIDFSVDMRGKAMVCLSYIDTNDTKEFEFAKGIIERYLNLREKRLSPDEITTFLKDTETEKFRYIEDSVS